MAEVGGVSDHWYEIVEDETLRQGDVLRSLVAFVFPQACPAPDDDDLDAFSKKIEVEWVRSDWIVLSASCDVERGPDRYPFVLLGQLVEATKKNLRLGQERFELALEVARRGLDPSKFLLPPSNDVEPPFPASFVHARIHVTMPLGYLLRHSRRKRLRLRHPLRESLGHWLGTNISRVGIEVEMQLPQIADRVWPEDVIATDNNASSADGTSSPPDSGSR